MTTTTTAETLAVCPACLWSALPRKNGTVRRHHPAERDHATQRQTQDRTRPVCEGTGQQPLTFGNDTAPVATPAAPTKTYVMCDDCDQRHEAEYSHDSQWGNHEPVYAVVCTSTPEWLTDYYLAERVFTAPAPAPILPF